MLNARLEFTFQYASIKPSQLTPSGKAHAIRFTFQYASIKPSDGLTLPQSEPYLHFNMLLLNLVDALGAK